ncbi:MAG: S53 family peptidase [Candidatus Korobacteraceae bacterium]|jgi:subtilase family serine protease
MNPRKLLLVATSLLLACQLGLAQDGRTTAAQVNALAALAQQTGRAFPIVPLSSQGHPRPFVWVAGRLHNQGIRPALPSFCNTNLGGEVIFVFCPNALQVTYQTNQISFANGGAGMVIGITDAFHYGTPTTSRADADLTRFDTDMGLPQCTLANGCFRDLNQNGSGSPWNCGHDSGWEVETMLDLEWAHAMAPNAKLVLVEGCTNDDSDLNQAVTTAAGLADVVSDSWGEGEFDGEQASDPFYFSTKPILFASGDGGAPGIYPCASPNVTCVGGTTLTPNLTTFVRVNETGWAGSGGGCSPFEPSQGFQTGNGVNICGSTRAVPDIAADADPNSGVAVYDSGNGGYLLVGGTSLATPLMAGIIADLDTARTTAPGPWRKPKLQGSAGSPTIDSSLYLKYAGSPTGYPYTYYYYDVVMGNNGFPAGPGYDLVTGLGVLTAPHAGPPFNLP